MIIDDMPGTTQVPFVYNVHGGMSWKTMAERIIEKHIDYSLSLFRSSKNGKGRSDFRRAKIQ